MRRRDLHFFVRPILDGAHFDGANLQDAHLEGAEAQGAYFTDAFLQNASMQGMDLQGAHFRKTHLADGHLDGARLQGAEFIEAVLERASFRNAVFEREERPSADFVGVRAKEAHFEGANLWGVRFLSCDLREVNFFCACLRDAVFEATNLTRANFHSAALHGVRLHNVRFDDGHLSLHDGTEEQLTSRRQKYFSWSMVRNLGQFPFFAVSWTAFFLALGTVEGLEKLNSWLTRYQRNLNLQGDLTLSVPGRIMWILFDALFLVIGSTLYRAFCPKRVQEFTEVAWVEQFGRPRLQYWEEAWRRPRLAFLTLMLLSLGALIAFLLVAERFVRAVRYVGDEYGWWAAIASIPGRIP